MINKIKNYMLVMSSMLLLAVPAVVPVAVSAACTGTATSIASGASSASDTTGNASQSLVTCGTVNDSTTGIQKLAGQIVNVFSIVVGIASVLMIIYGGFRYVTSGGDS